MDRIGRRRPQVLLLGNGIIRAYSSLAMSWEEMLRAIGTDQSVPDELNIPMPLEIVVRTRDHVDLVLGEHNKELYGAVETEEFGSLLRRLMSMGFDHILTTNYSYEMEEAALNRALLADDELEEANLKLIYDTYRRRHNIPMAEELTKMRERYGIPASAMSIILGIGENQYGLYEDGLVPSLSVGRLLELASNPLIMESMLLSARYKFSDKQYRKYYISIVASMHPAQYENDEMRVQDYINFSQFPSACVANTPAVQKSSIKYNSNKFSYAPVV